MGAVNATRADVARLFGRVSFGATSSDLDTWTGTPYASVVDAVLVRPDVNVRPLQVDESTRNNLELNAEYNIDACQRWWMERMRNGLYQAEERMTLFWHDHFSTGYGPEPFARAMIIQNQAIRVNALGNFRDLCNAMTVDCAMLEWLNGEENRVGAVNENYGREFFELFTLGVRPQVYTEADMEQSARALTGWTVYATNALAESTPNASRFIPSRHDTGSKTFLGSTIPANYVDPANEYKLVTDIALAKTVSAYFVAYKMIQNFGYEPVIVNRDITTNTDPLVAKVATTLRTSNWDILAAMKTMLNADEWRYATSLRVRQPVELIAHACKAIKLSADDAAVLQVAARMGQLLFQPPNVAGWPYDRAWFNQTTMIARYDLGVVLYPKWGLKAVFAPASNNLAGWAALLGVDTWSATTTAAVNSYLTARAGETEANKQAAVFTLLLSSPDWQVM